MSLCSSPHTIRTPIPRPLQGSKRLGGNIGIGKLSTAQAPTNGRHSHPYLGRTRHRLRVQSNTRDDIHGKQLDSSPRKNDRTQTLLKLRSEKLLLDASLMSLQTAVDKAIVSEPSKAASTELSDLQRTLQVDVMILKGELEKYRDVDPQQLEKKKGEAALLRANAERWTDNIELLEGWLSQVLAIDPYQLDCLRRECYGAEYIEGEGLKEL
ncbi:MAG: hypothetical protein Q9221_000995 [Calogaya cf. arnoldii]